MKENKTTTTVLFHPVKIIYPERLTILKNMYQKTLKRKIIHFFFSFFVFLQNWFKNRRAKWRKEPSTGRSSASSTMHVTTDPYLHCFAHVPYPSSNLMMRDARMLFGTDATAHESDECRESP